MALPRRPPFRIADVMVEAGRSASTEIPIARLVTGTRISLPIQVLHGRRDGPTAWVSAAVHVVVDFNATDVETMVPETLGSIPVIVEYGRPAERLW